jgi:hypothetical protein
MDLWGGFERALPRFKIKFILSTGKFAVIFQDSEDLMNTRIRLLNLIFEEIQKLCQDNIVVVVLLILVFFYCCVMIYIEEREDKNKK